jgi:predicted nucleotidyltransferase
MDIDDRQMDRQLPECIDLLKCTFGSDFLALYLYGSATLGGLHRYSDIDLLAVLGRPATPEEKVLITNALFNISGLYLKDIKRPVELTIVIKSDVNPWRYPPRFDYQFGEWLREKFQSGEMEPWKPKDMLDLTILITHVLVASRTLYGPAPDQLLAPVPYRDFITASTQVIDGLLADLESDTRNILLTLARIWSTFVTDLIRSKPAAAAWATGRLPEEFQSVMQWARAIYLGESPEGWDDLLQKIEPCAGFMVERIKETAVLLLASDLDQRSIRAGD